MRGFKPERAHYIPADATEQKDSESTAVAYLYSSGGKPAAVCFSAKRQKPDSHYRYSSEERRADSIARHFEAVRRREAYQAERREELKAARQADSSLAFEGRDYLAAAAVAALLRRTLKEAFPGHKFSVRSDGSLRVSWVDGPSRGDVEAIAKTFEGSYFDGMIDYKGSIYHELDGRRVRFGADFVFCEREMSREALDIGAAALRDAWQQSSGEEPCTFTEHETKWSKWTEIKANPLFPGSCEGRIPGEAELMAPEHPDRPSRAYRPERALELWFDTVRPVKPQESPTLARIRVLGTDGYGNTALGAADGGKTGRGYPEQKESPEAGRMREALEQAARDLEQTIAEADAQAGRGPESAPPPRECQVIDLLPHLIARADAARRVN